MNTSKLQTLGLKLALVQVEQTGTKHYVDELGNRLVLHADGSWSVDPSEQEADK